MNEAISNRSIFSYGYTRLWIVTNCSKPWLCCCRAKSKRDDFLYREAKKKLYTEIDLLEIVKQMRINMFASDIVLKPRQRYLVNFFEEYKLKVDKKESKAKMRDSKEVRSKLMKSGKGAKGQVPEHMEDLLTGQTQVHGIAEAVKESIPEEDPIDMHIYDRIICSDEDASDEELQLARLTSAVRTLRTPVSSPEMDEFISNLNYEQKRL